MDALRAQIQTLSDTDFTGLKAWIQTEETQRRRTAIAEAEVIADLRDRGVITPPAPPVPDDQSHDVAAYPSWKNPGTAHEKMYNYGDRVQHRGRIWESQSKGLNSWEPGAPGVYGFIWRDITDDLTRPESPAPPEEGTPDTPTPKMWRAGLRLEVGDLVDFNGAVYTVMQAHTSADHWPPDAAHSLYQAT